MMNENVVKVLKESMWDLATCKDGEPNVVPVAFKDVTDDGKLVVGDVFLETTIRNIQDNDGRIAISAYNANTLEGYQIKGRAEYVTSGPWSFTIAEGQAGHPLYSGIDFNDGESDKVYTCDAGYRISNSTAQWFIGDWSAYEDVTAFESRHGATALSVNANNGETSSVPVWEYPSTGSRGKVVCIGSGCYDWYSPDGDASADRYHGNVAKLTENALNYVSKE